MADIQTPSESEAAIPEFAPVRARIESSKRAELTAAIADLDLEFEEGEIAEPDYRSLRESYIGRIAQLCSLEDSPGEATTAESAAILQPAKDAKRSHGRRPRSYRWYLPAGIALVLCAGGILIFLFVSGSTSTRLPGESASGSLKLSSSQDLTRALQQAKALELEGNFSQALILYDQILAKYPHQPEALAYSGWILHLAGDSSGNSKLISQAATREQEVVAIAPGYPDARYFLGAILYSDSHDASAAVTQFTAFLGDKPSAAFLKDASSVIAQAYRDAGDPVPPQVVGAG